jgi:tetratricopeptide (TPR) repeat protein
LADHLLGEGPPLLVLAGEPGIGKSRLLQVAAQQAAAQGLCVLAGGCQRQGGQAPYAPLLEALAGCIGEQRHADLHRVLQGCAWLVRLLPELAEGPIDPVPHWTLSPDQERRLTFGAVARFLANVAGPAGTLLLLDDLQWAGADALDVLATLVRARPAAPLRVLGAYRDTETVPAGPLAGMLADLAHAGLAAHHTLVPLAPDACRLLLEAILGRPVGEAGMRWERLLQRTGGVPFYVLSCVQAVQAAEGLSQGHDVVPWSVAQSVRQRVALLPDAARQVLEVAAVAGREVPWALLVAAGPPEEVALAGLEAACRAQLLEEHGEEGYRFPHDLIREAVEADLGSARRALLHRRTGDALEQLPGTPQPALLAYHYLRAGERELAAVHLERAGDQARAQGALCDAEAAYRELVACLEELGSERALAGAREKLGDMLALQCHYDAALAVLDGAAASYRAAADREGLLRVTARLGWVHDSRGTAEEGLRRLLAVVAEQDLGTPSPGLALLLAALAALHTFLSGYGECLAAAERAAAMARMLGDDQLLVHTERVLAWALFFCGRHEEALARIRTTHRLAVRVGAVGDLSDLLQAAAVMCEMRGEFEVGKQMAQEAVSYAEQLGMLATLQVALTRLGVICFFSGAWDQARTHYARALAITVQSDAYHTALLHAGQLYLAEGSWEQARSYLRRSSDLARRLGQRIIHADAECHLAELDILTAKPEAAQARLLPLLEQMEMDDSTVITQVLPRLAWAALDLGQLDRATTLISDALRRQQMYGYRLALLDTLRVQGMICRRQGQDEAAAQALGAGLAVARQIGCPYGEARLLQACGRLHAGARERGPARTEIEAALAIFHRLGAQKDIEQAEQLRTILD